MVIGRTESKNKYDNNNNSQHSILNQATVLSAFCILTHLVFIATLRISATNGESEAQRDKISDLRQNIQ